jgi:uncharacterized membrane protein YfcA
MDEAGAILVFVAAGFAAQLVDGALGMAYGLTASSVLLGLGLTPAVTTAASGTAHWRLGNVAPRLLLRLTVPGALGGALGAWVLSDLPGGKVRPTSISTSSPWPG